MQGSQLKQLASLVKPAGRSNAQMWLVRDFPEHAITIDFRRNRGRSEQHTGNVNGFRNLPRSVSVMQQQLTGKGARTSAVRLAVGRGQSHPNTAPSEGTEQSQAQHSWHLLLTTWSFVKNY